MKRLPVRLRWLWPRTLSHRVALILVIGMLAAQTLTGTIWYERRYDQLLELPTRVLATRMADIVRLVDTVPPASREALLAGLQSPRFRLRLESQPPDMLAPGRSPMNVRRLFAEVMATRVGHPLDIRLVRAELLSDSGARASRWSFSRTVNPTARFSLAVRLPGDGRWLCVDAIEDESGQDTHWAEAVTDYLLRIYGIRMVLIVVLALFAVRLAMAPLNRMAQAAAAFGRDIHSAPLETDGPVEVARAAEAFNGMQRRLIEILAERSRFLAAVSHDLRSPITRLRLRTEMLRDEGERAKFRADLAEMEAMVDATLSFVQSGSEEGGRHDVDMNELLASIAQGWREQGATVTLRGEADRPLRCSEMGMRRCIQNLVENAIRYGGRADIVITDEPASLSVTVSDDGPGIPADQLEQVMEPFYRLEGSRNVAAGGVGLGLSIARAVANVHGGSLTLANAAAGGLQATVSVPRQESGAGRAG